MTAPAPGELRVAVATYHRTQTLQDTTLAFLARAGLSSVTDVWVADTDEEAAYRAAVPPHLYDRLIVGTPGLVNVRNQMMATYPIGTRVIHCNDDVDGVFSKVTDREAAPFDGFGSWAEEAFTLAAAADLSLWGLYPTVNPLWMKHRVKYGWQLTVGCLFGQVVTGAPYSQLPPGCDDKEDHYRSAQYFEAEGTLLRYDGVAVKTDYYRKPGGMTDVRTRESSQRVVDGLLGTWPHLFAPGREKRSYGFPEVRFRRLG